MGPFMLTGRQVTSRMHFYRSSAFRHPANAVFYQHVPAVAVGYFYANRHREGFVWSGFLIYPDAV